MELRDYQIKQMEFLKSKVSNNSKKLFNTNCSLESCTGSGKSIVMLEFIKDYFSNHSGKKIFLSTGFNKLVFQIYETALDMGLPVTILIGRNRCLCKKRYDGFPKLSEVFTLDNTHTASAKKCASCEYVKTTECYYNYVIESIENSKENMLIITNHSTLILKEDFFYRNTIGGFIDECQTFGDFYESSMKIEVPYNELKSILWFIKRDSFTSKNSLLVSAYELNMNKGTLTVDTMSKVLNMATSKKNRRGETLSVAKFFPTASNEVTKWASASNNDKSVYVHPQIEDGQHIGLLVDKFFIKTNLPMNVCLVSATVDSYTKSIFSLNNPANNYVETNCDIIDYSKSNCFIYDDFTMDNIKKFISLQTKNHGLLLSTRLDIVEEMKELSVIDGYEIITSQEQFVDGEKQILVGSKSLFQGVDIQGINFVLINKLPFQRFDESYKKKMLYFDSEGLKSYQYYTIPYTTNQCIQAMGRLWRRAGDYGNVAIFDGRALNKHRRILNDALSYRSGMNLIKG